MPELIISNDFYDALYTDRKSSRVTVVFSSAGALALAEPIEEFKRTIEKFDSSYVFVWSKNLDWYNNKFAARTMKTLAEFCSRFEKVYTLGESLGGSGALLFAKYCKNLTRILAFSPQYSSLPEYCKWDGPLTPMDGAFYAFMFANYAPEEAYGKSVLLYPTNSHEDNLHAKLFKADGFDVVLIKSYHHDMARSLKKDYDRNYLHTVLACMYDDRFEFTTESYNGVLFEIIEKNRKTYSKWIGNNTFHFSDYIDLPDEKHIIDTGFTCSLSSVSHNQSQTQDMKQEAGRLITGPLYMTPSCHTETELNPWWMVEFDSVQSIGTIVIFNRCDEEHGARAFSNFYISASVDGTTWHEIYRKETTEIVGGEYGEPLRIDHDFSCRFMKITIPGYSALHLSKINIYRQH